ncbi:MAG TPA: peptidylprolyl isomerase [Candidatus Krumholzibacteria bacterium]|nr:peptidylprolyl isomerase [Candidatus Krumholzibacteria bacterium]HRX50344.1 peptidylprolyl isomerase [Candidatus Krumholzibacteria bacterium]
MKRALVCLSAVLLLGAAVAPAQTFVRLGTDEGDILLVLKPEVAPRHVANFLALGEAGMYQGTYFHRVIPGFMIQGGDPNTKNDDRADDGQGGPAWSDLLSGDDLKKVEEVRALLEARGLGGLPERASIRAEFNDETHVRGTLSMARANHPDSAGSQFFITVADTPHLDRKYTVFGSVVSGMDVVDAIVGAARDNRDNPLEPIHITGFTELDGPGALSDDERAAWDAFGTAASEAVGK